MTSTQFPSNPFQFLIIDDHPRLRATLRKQILQVWPAADVLEAPTLARGLALMQHHRFCAVILDLSLPDQASSIEGPMRAMKMVRHKAPVLAMGPEGDRIQAALLLAVGVSGYVPRECANLELIPALQRLLEGGRFVTAGLASVLLKARTRESLSPRS